jgi:hypothetical protein
MDPDPSTYSLRFYLIDEEPQSQVERDDSNHSRHDIYPEDPDPLYFVGIPILPTTHEGFTL